MKISDIYPNDATAANKRLLQDDGQTVSCRQLNSRQLFGGDKELLIEHEKQHYRLRITRQNKLILTK